MLQNNLARVSRTDRFIPEKEDRKPVWTLVSQNLTYCALDSFRGHSWFRFHSAKPYPAILTNGSKTLLSERCLREI